MRSGLSAPSIDETELPEDFLAAAVRAFAATGHPDSLWNPTPPSEPSLRHQLERRYLAHKRRMEQARAAVLWSAIAVEAAINLYMSAALPPAEAEAIDGLPTVNKLLLAPRLATGKDLFSRGEAVVRDTWRLFALRNRIVHPKVGKQSIAGEVGLADFTPRAAADGMIAAATVLRRFELARPDKIDDVDSAAKTILAHKDLLKGASRKWTEALPEIPDAALRRI